MEYQDVKKENIAILPTPIHKLEKISEKFSTNIFIKRDDLTGIGMGGNKLRKLEYLIKDALEQGCTALLTYGGVQSNHAMLTAAVAAKFGLKSILLLNNYEESLPEISGNLLLDILLGADIRFIDLFEKEKVLYNEIIQKESKTIIEEYEANGDKLYIIPMGGSSSLGSLGYVDAIREIQEQSNQMKIKFDYIICGNGSKGTFAGLWLGSKYYQDDIQVVGINVLEESQEESKEKASQLINKTANEYNMGILASPSDLLITDAYVGAGYAVPDKETFACIRELARLEGIFIDPTYTGKVFRGLLDMINKKEIKNDANILFLHTGGYPGLFGNDNVEFVKNKLH